VHNIFIFVYFCTFGVLLEKLVNLLNFYKKILINKIMRVK